MASLRDLTMGERAGPSGLALRALAAGAFVIVLLLAHRHLPTVMIVLGLATIFPVRLRRLPRWGWAALGLIAYATLSIVWSPYEDRTSWLPNFAALAIVSLGLFAADGPMTTRLWVGAVAVALALLFLEALTGGWIRDVIPPEGRPDRDDVATARGITALIAFLPALALVGWRQFGVHGLLLLAVPVFWVSASFGIAANLMATLAAVVGAAFSVALPGMSLRLAMVGAGAGFLVMPIAATLLPKAATMLEWTTGPASWRMRLLIWKDVNTAIASDPLTFLFGRGVEAARVLGLELGPRLVPGAQVASAAVPTHPHNVYLQVWHDLGLVGVALSIAALVFGARALERAALPTDAKAAIVALILATTAFAWVDSSLWTIWRVVAPLIGAWLLACVVKCRLKKILPI